MPALDPVKYAKAKALLAEAVRKMFDPGDDWRDLDRMLAALRAHGLDPSIEPALTLYLTALFAEAEHGDFNPFAPPEPSPELANGAQHDPQLDLFNPAVEQREAGERALIEQLIAATKLYDTSERVQELLDFTTRLRAFAPFNAMLLHIQKPGLTYAATAQDWLSRFQRAPKIGARPLLVLRTKGPVDFVFDVQDTDGEDLPEGAFSFPTFGELSDARLNQMLEVVAKARIELTPIDAGDASAGWIRVKTRSRAKSGRHVYQLGYNKNHSAPTRFVTVAHELAHLFLGHLGADPGRRVPDRRDTPEDLAEVEAEMAAYLVAKRNGVTPRSESYLSTYKGALGDLNLYGVTRAANAIETTMGIGAHELWLGMANG